MISTLRTRQDGKVELNKTSESPSTYSREIRRSKASFAESLVIHGRQWTGKVADHVRAITLTGSFIDSRWYNRDRIGALLTDDRHGSSWEFTPEYKI